MPPGRSRALNALNFQHLLYFWTAARMGGIGHAAKELHLSQPTVSGQIKVLERSLGEVLFERRGRTLVLTEVGHIVFQYADEMFNVGRELQETLAGNAGAGRGTRLAIGISDALPKLTTYRLLEPALVPANQYRLVLHSGKTENLLTELATHELDIVLTDSQAPVGSIRAFSHLLGESEVAIFGTADLAARYRRNFPKSLHDAPFLMHGNNTALRRTLDRWLNDHDIRPHLVAEVEDVALLQVLGQQGMGLFAAPSVVEEQICRDLGLVCIGKLPQVREQFFAVSMDRKLKHLGVLAIQQAARLNVFR